LARLFNSEQFKLFFQLPFKLGFYLIFKGKAFKHLLLKSLLKLREALEKETEETKEMLVIYHKFSKGQASKDEMLKANAQFRDLIKSLGLGVLLVLPFAPLTLPFFVKLGKYLGVNILPSSFQIEEKTDNKS
jgi:hypothetical protein